MSRLDPNSLRILIASGPTREPMDPVRFISNYSTGVMGRHLRDAAKARGHAVTFVECPKDAETARELQKKLSALMPKHDVLIMAAAVCDARPAVVSKVKIKKDSLRSIQLVKNPDILASLAKKKKKCQVFIGFGLESSDLIKKGHRKLIDKGLDVIVLQKVTKTTTPFGERAIDAVILDKRRNSRGFNSISKEKLAMIIVGKSEDLVKVLPARKLAGVAGDL